MQCISQTMFEDTCSITWPSDHHSNYPKPPHPLPFEKVPILPRISIMHTTCTQRLSSYHSRPLEFSMTFGINATLIHIQASKYGMHLSDTITCWKRTYIKSAVFWKIFHIAVWYISLSVCWLDIYACEYPSTLPSLLHLSSTNNIPTVSF